MDAKSDFPEMKQETAVWKQSQHCVVDTWLMDSESVTVRDVYSGKMIDTASDVKSSKTRRPATGH